MVNVLRQAGAEVVLASVEPELQVKLSGGTILVADISIDECSDHIFDLVALPVSFTIVSMILAYPVIFFYYLSHLCFSREACLVLFV